MIGGNEMREKLGPVKLALPIPRALMNMNALLDPRGWVVPLLEC